MQDPIAEGYWLGQFEKVRKERDSLGLALVDLTLTNDQLRASIVRHHDTTIMAKLQSGVRCPACSALDTQEPR